MIDLHVAATIQGAQRLAGAGREVLGLREAVLVERRVAVQPHAVAELPPEELVDRQPGPFADDIPWLLPVGVAFDAGGAIDRVRREVIALLRSPQPATPSPRPADETSAR